MRGMSMASRSRFASALLSAVVTMVGLSCEHPEADTPPIGIAASALEVEIDDCAGLQAMREDLGGAYRLIADVDCTGFDFGDGYGFHPIGEEGDPGPFTGSFDGDGHLITGITIARPELSRVGLFGAAEGALIQRVGVVGALVEGAWSTGALVGAAMDTTVRESFATGVVSGEVDVGALVGGQYEGGLVADSYAAAAVTGQGDY